MEVNEGKWRLVKEDEGKLSLVNIDGGEWR